MKATFRIAVIAAGFAVAAWPALRADDQPAPPQPPQPPAAGGEHPEEVRPRRWQRDPMERLEHLKQALDLTKEQSDQVAAIIKDGASQRRAIMTDDSLSRNDKRTKMQELRQGTDARIRALLTPEQQKRFDAMARGPWARNGGPNQGNPPPPPPPPPPPQQRPPPPPPPNPPGGGNG